MQGKLSTFKTGSQNDLILNYLQQGNTLTVETARKLGFGSNLRSRVSNLKEKGIDVISERVNIKNGFIAKYYIEEPYYKRLCKHHKNMICDAENAYMMARGEDLVTIGYKSNKEIYELLEAGMECFPF